VSATPLNPVMAAVTERVIERSRAERSAYLDRLAQAAERRPRRAALGCANHAHAFAACDHLAKVDMRGSAKPNIGIVSSYNDVLSAHQPYETFPRVLKDAIRKAGGVGQFAGGVPAMCDGVTQGFTGMELSLFSREVIAMATAVALSHDIFDGSLLLGICDKIVPGLVAGGLAFGHLPTILVPGGPMPTGLSNSEKSHVRQLFAEGRIARDKLLQAEEASYHGPGTCTFYGTANSNQMVVEIMGLHLPGAAFVNPGTPLREALTRAAGARVTQLAAPDGESAPMGKVVDERSVVNGVVALLATGGSTNHTLHLPAMAAAAGITLTWDDFSDLSAAVPLLARVYPNGKADINHFHAAGGTAFIVGQLLDAGLLHRDVLTVAGQGLNAYRSEPFLTEDGSVTWRPGPAESLDPNVLRPVDNPFSADGGLRMVRGNIGRAVVKVSAVAHAQRIIEAPARVFDDQRHMEAAFKDGSLDGDVVVVVRYQGPKANGMPELHKLTPILGVLQDRGHRVALLTDGRMSGASGKIPCAIHLTPEAASGGPITRIRDGDMVRLDTIAGTLEVAVSPKELADRPATGGAPSDAEWVGTGRELFTVFRREASDADRGASVFGLPIPGPETGPPYDPDLVSGFPYEDPRAAPA
jgi:phosphogluconate dehydratase